MKTKFFSIMLLCAAVAFVSCDPKTPTPDQPGGNGDTDGVEGIVVEPSELTLSIGESTRLSYKLLPEGVSSTAVTWATSDSTIVSVTNKGYIEALDYGTANIIVSCGQFSDTCVVTIKTYYENLLFTNALLFDIDTTAYDPSKTYIITESTGKKFTCYLAEAEYWLCADGFYVNNSGELDGSTYASYISVKAPFFYGPKWMNGGQGASFVLGDWSIGYNKADTIMPQDAKSGAVDETAYMAALHQFTEDYNAAVKANDKSQLSAAYKNLAVAAEAISGTVLETMEWHTTAEGYPENGYYSSYIPDGLITEGYFGVYETTSPVSDYMFPIEYNIIRFKPFGGAWGGDFEQDSETGIITWVSEAMQYDDVIEYTYGELPTGEAAPRLVELNVPIIKQDCPALAKKLEAMRDMNTLHIKK